MNYEDLMKEFKLFREQVYSKINEFEEILRGLHEENSEAIDDIVVTLLEKDGESNVDRLKKLYSKGRITEAGLQNAIDRGWITQEQMEIIIGS